MLLVKRRQTYTYNAVNYRLG